MCFCIGNLKITLEKKNIKYIPGVQIDLLSNFK